MAGEEFRPVDDAQGYRVRIEPHAVIGQFIDETVYPSQTFLLCDALLTEPVHVVQVVGPECTMLTHVLVTERVGDIDECESITMKASRFAYWTFYLYLLPCRKWAHRHEARAVQPVPNLSKYLSDLEVDNGLGQQGKFFSHFLSL